jgi:hypothetical protein
MPVNPKDVVTKVDNAPEHTEEPTPRASSPPRTSEASDDGDSDEKSEYQKSAAERRGSSGTSRRTSQASGESETTALAPAPPLPAERPPDQADDGWEFHWRPEYNAYAFYNRLTQQWQWENPRLPANAAMTSAAAPGVTVASSSTGVSGPPPLPSSSTPGLGAGGYNPAIHGDYDPNAWYAQPAGASVPTADVSQQLAGEAADYVSAGLFNRITGQWQNPEDQGVERHGDEAKSKRQMNAYFDVDAAANSHAGRSLKAERSGKKPSKSELKAFKEKRKARKDEKRRAWLRD